MNLDYNLNPQERKEYVDNLLKSYTPTSKELLALTDYLLFIRDKNQTKQEKEEEYSITTSNREATIDKRQLSYEGLIEKLENGEDGLFTLIDNDRENLLDRKDPITDQDISNIPGLKESFETLESLQKQYESAEGRSRKFLKKALIETWKQIYSIKSSHKIGLPFSTTNNAKNLIYMPIAEDVYFDDKAIPHSDSFLSLLNPEQVSFLLQYFEVLKVETWEALNSDMRWHLIDLENLAEKALKKKHPVLWDILIWKIQKYTNKEIRQKVLSFYGEDHSEQYYSSVWRKRIPNLIVEEAQKLYTTKIFLDNSRYYWKVCSKCGARKPGHSLFFSRNSSKDGFYSQCKECKKRKEVKSGH